MRLIENINEVILQQCDCRVQGSGLLVVPRAALLSFGTTSVCTVVE